MRTIGTAVTRVAAWTVPGAVIGLITAGLAFGVGEFAAVWSGPQTAPALAVGSAARPAIREPQYLPGEGCALPGSQVRFAA